MSLYFVATSFHFKKFIPTTTTDTFLFPYRLELHGTWIVCIIYQVQNRLKIKLKQFLAKYVICQDYFHQCHTYSLQRKKNCYCLNFLCSPCWYIFNKLKFLFSISFFAIFSTFIDFLNWKKHNVYLQLLLFL